ncbi:MAG: hypothetical protein ABIP85_00345 [Chthoniobacteraceae bacterium]
MCDLLSQTVAFYDNTVIIKEGLSYAGYTQTVEPGTRPIIIEPDWRPDDQLSRYARPAKTNKAGCGTSCGCSAARPGE